MDAIELNRRFVLNYKGFPCSFTSLSVDDLRHTVDQVDESDRQMPEAMITPNPQYVAGRDVVEPAANKITRGPSGEAATPSNGLRFTSLIRRTVPPFAGYRPEALQVVSYGYR